MFSWPDLASITGGEWVSGPDRTRFPRGVCAVVDDSRTVVEGSLFTAVPGERTDGHEYVGQAAAAGAAAIMVRRDRLPLPDLPSSVGVLAVADTLAAFHALARVWRRRFSHLHVTGVTGSNGKTSVKEMLGAILEAWRPGCVLRSEGNTNNQFGVPRNLFRLRPEHAFAVIELGTSEPGEIRSLCGTVEPDSGIITSIGPAHLQAFGDTCGVAREKSDLFRSLPAGGIAVFPLGTPCEGILRGASRGRNVIRVACAGAGETPPDGADLVACYEGRGADGKRRFRLVGRLLKRPLDVVWDLGGRHQAANAAAAAALALCLGAPPEAVAAGLAHTRLPPMRMEHRIVDGIHWLNDAYNANSASIRAGIEWFIEESAGVRPEQRIIVLGDILELGGARESEHRETLEWVLARCSAGVILTVGEAMGRAAAEVGLPNAVDVEGAQSLLAPHLAPGRWVFLKGSRGMGLERLVPRPGRAAE